MISRIYSYLFSCCLYTLDLEWREESIIDPLGEGVFVDRFAEIVIRIDIIIALRRCRESEMYRSSEIPEYLCPVSIFSCSSTMTLIDDDEIEKIALIFPEIRSRISLYIDRTTHKCLENCEKNTSIFGDISLLGDITRIDPHQSIFWKR